MSWQPLASLEVIHQRAHVYQKIRSFFGVRGCLEVETPLLMPTTNSDLQVESISLRLNSRDHYLQTSPEFAMKRLLAAGSDSIYQICHAFRGGEKGRRHNCEFSLLEWYRVGFDYRLLMDEIELLITSVSHSDCVFTRLSYRQLFQQYLQLDIESVSLSQLRDCCSSLADASDSSGLDFDECLDLLLAVVIAAQMQGYQFVYDYPISQAALARPCADNPAYAERFELFHDGLELANGYSELTDAVQQRQRFQKDNLRRAALGLPRHALDENLLAALQAGLPECAGVALGLDRLLMVLLGLDSIEQCLSFAD